MAQGIGKENPIQFFLNTRFAPGIADKNLVGLSWPYSGISHTILLSFYKILTSKPLVESSFKICEVGDLKFALCEESQLISTFYSIDSSSKRHYYLISNFIVQDSIFWLCWFDGNIYLLAYSQLVNHMGGRRLKSLDLSFLYFYLFSAFHNCTFVYFFISTFVRHKHFLLAKLKSMSLIAIWISP